MHSNHKTKNKVPPVPNQAISNLFNPFQSNSRINFLPLGQTNKNCIPMKSIPNHQSNSAAPNLPQAFRMSRRRAGKIAHLPEPIQEQINLMLEEGLTYKRIVAALADAVPGLNKDNLSRWRKAGHQDWLRDRLWRQAFHDQPHLADHPLRHLIMDLASRPKGGF
jgi:hypothetical protein